MVGRFRLHHRPGRARRGTSVLLPVGLATAAIVASSVTGTARERSAANVQRGRRFADTFCTSAPSLPRTDRTKTVPSTVTTQIVVRCVGASSSRLVSIRTSLVPSISRKVSESKESFTAGSFFGASIVPSYSTAEDAGNYEHLRFG